MLSSRKEAYEFLESLVAPEHLKTHVSLVGEAADMLIEALGALGVNIDPEFIRVGVVIHDVGKIIYTNELCGPGSEHEPEGERILLEKGASNKLARVCMSHARWNEMECSLEELLIALSDKLWKGKRVEKLELQVVDRIASNLRCDRWEVFPKLDMVFEEIASGGHERLQRSVVS
ncbi:HD domain-containing protein [Microbulbifer bruguierae]|uniref:HD domain-containing protein n=1 Tax=Microbulbifer bruguierae TaxID=3029061 RepID=A0ABY8NC54_9GAMM|nr:HD domain-containing protein [Microbulbifer bruguierae]WGL16025.1 HD domain-containing protein [Microbulbifer bruguierae]